MAVLYVICIMKRFNFYFISCALLSLVLVLGACDKDDEPDTPPQTTGTVHEVSIYPFFGADSLYLDSVYQTVEGYRVKFTELKLFCSEIGNSGGTIAVDAALFDYAYSQHRFCSFSAATGLYPNLSGYIGIDSLRNHADPSAFPTSSPLNIVNANDMHWGWNPGYIFMKIEARVDTIDDGSDLFDHNVVFHVGNDENRVLFGFPSVNWKQENGKEIARIKWDLAAVLQGASPIDFKTEFTSHSAPGQEALSLKVITQTAAALSILP